MKNVKSTVLVFWIIGAILVSGTIVNAASPAEIPRMSIETLKDLLDDQEAEVVVLDVRTGASWASSEYMIETAVREEPGEFATWVGKYSKEKPIVLYCT